MVDHGTGSIRELHTRPAGCIYVHAGTQLEISSTELRALLVAGRDPRYLVPEEVRQIILETRCYASPQQDRSAR
jgi:nicotinate-nucleotide adenylyltransferase